MVLSFNLGDEITIYSKEAGQNKELWGAEVIFIILIVVQQSLFSELSLCGQSLFN